MNGCSLADKRGNQERQIENECTCVDDACPPASDHGVNEIFVKIKMAKAEIECDAASTQPRKTRYNQRVRNWGR